MSHLSVLDFELEIKVLFYSIGMTLLTKTFIESENIENTCIFKCERLINYELKYNETERQRRRKLSGKNKIMVD